MGIFQVLTDNDFELNDKPSIQKASNKKITKRTLMYTLNVAESKEESDDQTVYVEASGVGQIEKKLMRFYKV